MFDKIIEQMKILYQQAKIIHGDLSEYNILVHNNNPTIIDFPQAIDMSLLRNYSNNRMNANLNVLQKDIYTVCHFFEKEYFIETDFEKIFQYIAGKDAFREKVDFTTKELDEIIEKQNHNLLKK